MTDAGIAFKTEKYQEPYTAKADASYSFIPIRGNVDLESQAQWTIGTGYAGYPIPKRPGTGIHIRYSFQGNSMRSPLRNTSSLVLLRSACQWAGNAGYIMLMLK